MKLQFTRTWFGNFNVAVKKTTERQDGDFNAGDIFSMDNSDEVYMKLENSSGEPKCVNLETGKIQVMIMKGKE